MPHIVIKCDGHEIDRRELNGPLVIGRAPDCDVAVRDILLSRRHCRLEEEVDGWRVVDLGSKNGTFLNGQKLSAPRRLEGYDVVQIGRARIVFYVSVPDENMADRLMSPGRPADPNDSLSGTLSGFTLLMPGESEAPKNMPFPNPRPKDPAAYENPELQDLLRSIASSSWDSIYSEARQQTRERRMDLPEDDKPRRVARPRSPMDLSLQVNPSAVSEPEIAVAPRSVMRMWRGRMGRQNSSVALAVCLAAALGLMKTWSGRSERVIRMVPAAAEVIAATGVQNVAFSSVAAPVHRPPSRIPLDWGSLQRAGKVTAGLAPLLLW